MVVICSPSHYYCFIALGLCFEYRRHEFLSRNGKYPRLTRTTGLWGRKIASISSKIILEFLLWKKTTRKPLKTPREHRALIRKESPPFPLGVISKRSLHVFQPFQGRYLSGKLMKKKRFSNSLASFQMFTNIPISFRAPLQAGPQRPCPFGSIESLMWGFWLLGVVFLR